MAIKKGGGQSDLILNIILGVVVIGILGVYFLRQYRVWKTKEQKTSWPLNISPCPDYWKYDSGSRTCTLNTKDSTASEEVAAAAAGCSAIYHDVSNQRYSYDFSGETDASKCEIAKRCGLAWDGIADKC